MEIQNYKVYIKTSQNNHITAIDADWNIQDTTDWTYIDEGQGDKYHHAQGNYLDRPLMDTQGCHNYKYIDGEIIETTEQEKATELASFPKPEPTADELQAEQNIDFDYRLSLIEIGI